MATTSTLPEELDDEALAAVLREAMLAGAPVRQVDLWLATVAVGRVVDALRLRGVRVLREPGG